MARVHVDARAVTITLTGFERLFCGGRARFVVPRSEIASVERVGHPTRMSVTGIGRVGLGVSGVIKIGRWGLGTSRRRWVSARRSVPALHLVVRDGFDAQLGYHELVISTPDAAELAADLAPAAHR